MTAMDFRALLPLLVVFGGTVVVMLAIAVQRHHLATAGLSLLTLAAAFGSLWAATPRQVTPLLLIDSYALFFMGVILAASAVVVVLSYTYFATLRLQCEEFYVLLLTATAGAMVLAASTHLASLFLGIELLSVPLFAMIGYLPGQLRPLEAALKYLVLAAASVAFLLFGLALVYTELGTLEFGRMADQVAGGVTAGHPLLVPGFALILTGIGFKLALVPFHLWTPDVYEGAPAPASAFIATVSKAAVVAVLVRFFYHSGAHTLAPVFLLFSLMAVASMLAGNVLALLQDNVKRILAYSSIAHLGYILVAFQAGGPMAASAVSYYVAAYVLTTLAAFGVISALSSGAQEPVEIEDYRGLFWARPVLAGTMSVALLSLAGVPVTAGFFAKYYVLVAGTSTSLWLLAIVLVVSSAMGLFYYLRILVVMYASPERQTEPEAIHRPVPTGVAALLAALAVAVLWIGTFPSPLLAFINSAVAAMLHAG